MNKRHQFVSFRPLQAKEQVVSTIGGQRHFTLGIGDVAVSWRDDDSKPFRHILKDALFFSDSPVCIISSHKLAGEWGAFVDEEGTSIKSKHSYSVFKWNRKQFRKTIPHPSHGLPEMVVNDDLPSLFSALCQYCSSSASSLRAHYCVFRVASGDVSSPSFPLSAVMRYSKDGFTSPCAILKSVDPAKPDSQFLLKLQCGRILESSPEFVHHPDDPDIAAIPSTVPNFRREFDNVSDLDLAFLANPRELEDDEKLWLRYHNQLNHLSRADMFRLSQSGVLLQRLQKFRYRAPFCA